MVSDTTLCMTLLFGPGLTILCSEAVLKQMARAWPPTLWWKPWLATLIPHHFHPHYSESISKMRRTWRNSFTCAHTHAHTKSYANATIIFQRLYSLQQG